MKGTSRSAFLLLTLLSAVLTGFSFAEKPIKATWLWQTTLIASEPDQILAFSKAQRINLLYLKIDTTRTAAYYQSFIKRAREAGIEVHALGGKGTWALEQNRSQILALVDWVHRYNQTVPAAETISGIHLDIEPHVLPEWKTDKNSIIRQWMGNVDAYLQQAKKDPSLHVGCDIPFWLDKTYLPDDPDTTLTEWLIGKHDHVTVMAYRDRVDGSNSISSLVPNELAMAEALGKKIVLAVETKQSSEGDFVTFYEEGKAHMNGELEKLTALLSSHPSYAGTAIHSYEYWKALKN
jgi:hypothetical protein